MLLKTALGSLSYVIYPARAHLKKKIKSFIFFLRFLKVRTIGNLVLLKYLKTNDFFFNMLNQQFKLITISLAPGTYFKILGHSFCKNFLFLKIPSGQKIKVSIFYFGVLGKNSNEFSKKEIIGAAGRNNHFGHRPHVRGVAMNPVDHPHGGRTKTNKPEVSP